MAKARSDYDTNTNHRSEAMQPIAVTNTMMIRMASAITNVTAILTTMIRMAKAISCS